MKKECLYEENEHKMILSFFPENVSECYNWYPQNYIDSIKEYSKIILMLCNINTESKTLMLSYYQSNEKLNSLQRKKGMSGIFSKYGKNYQSNLEKIVEQKDSDDIISVMEVTSSNIENLFFSRVNSFVCSDNHLTANKLLENACKNGFEKLIEIFRKNVNFLIQFNDIGCDGNSITVYFTELYQNTAKTVKNLML